MNTKQITHLITMTAVWVFAFFFFAYTEPILLLLWGLLLTPIYVACVYIEAFEERS